jgi:DNA-binding MarR family transcriptional regulator
MARTGPPTIFVDVFLSNQLRKRMIEAALAGTNVPPEDYPFYVFIGADGPWTPTGLAAFFEMPLSTVLFRLGRLERRGHVERVPNPDDGRSYLVRLTDEGQRLLDEARPAFRDYAEAVEERLGPERVEALRAGLDDFRATVADEIEARSAAAQQQRVAP